MTDAANPPARSGDGPEEPPGLARRGPPSKIWLIVLAGPVIWFAHFGAVYLLSEVACRFGLLEGEVLGLRALAVVVLAATIVAAAGALVPSVLAWRRWHHLVASGIGTPPEQRGAVSDRPHPSGRVGAASPDRDRSLAFVGVLLGVMFVLAILAVGLPALVLAPC